LGHSQLSEKVKLSPNKTSAVIALLHLQQDPECYKKVQIGKSSVFNRYSQKAITKIQEALKEKSADKIWGEYKAMRAAKRK
jgi:hypothetical protein